MKTFLTATAIVTGLASTAMAGALELVPAVEATLEAPATDWSGPYAGVLAATGSATQDYTQTVEAAIGTWTKDDMEGSMFGAFAGYNFQKGALVYGVEAAYSMGSLIWSQPNGENGELGMDLTSVIDLKARAGIAAGNALLYGFAGWSIGDVHYFENLIPDEGYSFDGLNYGVGAEYLVTDNVFVGAEYIIRDVSADITGGKISFGYDTVLDLGVQAIQLRVGMTF